MTLVPFTNWCLLVGVAPKTLRLWLRAAQLGFTPHPTDARLKCLVPSQLRHLAALQGRFLPDPLPSEVSGPPTSPVPPAAILPQAQSAPSRTGAPALQADWRQQLTLLHAQVTTLQQQVTELALALVRERLSAATHQSPPPLPPPAASPSRQGAPPAPSRASTKADQPAARSRALPLLE